MGKRWFRTPEQDSFLNQQVKNLINAHSNNTIKDFCHQLHETWEARWPEVEVLFPQRTDADPQMTKEQIDELTRAMASQKQVSLILIYIVTVFVLRFYP